MTSHFLAGALIASSKSVDNALNAAWRDTTSHMIVKASWKDDHVQDCVDVHEYMTNKAGKAMRHLSPDSGC